MAWLARWSLALCLFVIMAGGGVAAAMFSGDAGSTAVKSAVMPDALEVAPVVAADATDGVRNRDDDDDDGGGGTGGDDDDDGGGGTGGDDDDDGGGGDDDDGNGGDDDDDGNGGDDDDDGNGDDDDEGDDDDDNGGPCVPGDPRPECNPDPGDGNFTCRASVLRYEDHPFDDLIDDPFELFVANPDNDPCRVDSSGVIDTTIGGRPGQPGSLRIAVLHSTTDNSQGADADAGVLIVELRDGTGAMVVRVGVLNASAEGRCVGDDPRLTSRSEVVSVFVRGVGEVAIPPGNAHAHVTVPGVVIVHLNHQEGGTAEGEIIQRAVWIETPDGSPIEPLGDVIIAEAIADFEGDPCDD